jgi:hypothetical protein
MKDTARPRKLSLSDIEFSTLNMFGINSNFRKNTKSMYNNVNVYTCMNHGETFDT